MNWINVKNKLPEPDQEVIVFDNDPGRGIGVTHAWYDPSRNGNDHHLSDWVYEYNRCCGDNWLDNVTHWMPFPSNPEDK